MSLHTSNAEGGPRRPSKKTQHRGQQSRSTMSDNDAYATMIEQNIGSGDGKARPRRKSHAARKNGQQHDSAAQSDGSTYRYPTNAPQTQATPIKAQAYAGPTFHQSPAASALPIPSWYSRSLPNASPLKNGIKGTQSPPKSLAELDEPDAASVSTHVKRDSTPLDFLFDAARKASVTPGAETPNHRHYLSSAADTPASRSPAPRDGDADFPFELDSGDQNTWNGNSTLSTPYKDRIEAVRSQRTPSAGGKTLDEEERKAKTAALKHFLMHSAQTQAASSDDNPFNARAAPTQPHQYRHHSNPNTPYHAPGAGNSYQYFPPMPSMPNAAHYQSPSRHGPSSSLRNIYQPGSDTGSRAQTSHQQTFEQPLISTARDQAPNRMNFADIYKISGERSKQDRGSSTRADPQQLEDDLRKILKLDLTSHG